MRYSWASMDTNCTSNQPHFTSTCVAGTWQDIEIPFFLFLRFVLLFSNFPQVPSRVMTYPMKWFKKFLWLVGLPAKVPSHLSTVTTMAVFLHITWSSADTMNFPPPYGFSSSLILLDFARSCCSLAACVLQKERHSCPPNLFHQTLGFASSYASLLVIVMDHHCRHHPVLSGEIIYLLHRDTLGNLSGF
jgi:hypothetical protein